MEDNRALEKLLEMTDDAISVFSGDSLREDGEAVFFSYSVEDRVPEVKEEPLTALPDASSCHECAGYRFRRTYASGTLPPSPSVLFVLPSPFGDTLLSPDARSYFSKWIAAMGLDRKKVGLTTLVKCPVKPFRKEAADACRKHLRSEMDSLGPKLMVLLGEDTARYMLRREGTMEYFRQKRFTVNGIPVYCTWSPEDLVASRSLRAPIWEDLQLISRAAGGRS